MGYHLAGGILIALGWGMAVVVNLLLHLGAPSGGQRVAGIWFGPTLGPYAWAALAFGAGTGVLGLVLLGLARASPKGRIALPGYDY